MELKSEVFILTVFVASCAQSKLSPNGDNVCLQSETYNDTVVVKTMKPITKTMTRTCWKWTKMFRCGKTSTEWEEVEETRMIQRSRIVAKCCKGYAEHAGNDNCQPVCSEGCLNGACEAPDTCACASGFKGPRCDEPVSTQTSTQKPPTTSSSDSTTSYGASVGSSSDSTASSSHSTTSTSDSAAGYSASTGSSSPPTTSSSHPTKSIAELSQEMKSKQKFLSESLQGVNLESNWRVIEDTTEDSDEKLKSASIEVEISTEKAQNEGTTTEQLWPNFGQSVVTTEETAEPKNDDLSPGEMGLGAHMGSTQYENLSGDESTEAQRKLGGTGETTTPEDEAFRTTFKDYNAKLNDDADIILYTSREVHFSPGMCVLSVVSVLVGSVAAGWMVARLRKKAREVRMEQKHQQVNFQAENFFHVSKILESATDLAELEKNDSTPVLKTFKPFADEKELVCTGRCIS